MRNFYFFWFFLIGIFVNSQVIIGDFAIGYTRDVEGVIVLKNGESILGKLTLPGSFDTQVSINNKKIFSKDIDHIDAHHSENENTYRFLFVELKRYKKNGELINWQNKNGWVVLSQIGERANQCAFAPQYRMNSKGELLLQMKYNSAFPVFGIKSHDDKAIMISLSTTNSGLELGTRKFFINSAKRFFSDDPNLVKKIETKQLGIEDIPTIFQIYNQE